ncbi:hypothetical protein JL720_3136 [Aureococcus anophagefferens]|nr:hypothetical protein JL720_3136 [Aureococcus anophagefferens]
MLKMHLPRGAVEQKMRAEGVDPALLDEGGPADALAKYRKMLKMHLPRGAVEQKMRAEGVDPALLDGDAPEAAVALAVAEEPAVAAVKDDPTYAKFFKMLAMHMPRGAVEQKLAAEGLDPAVLDLDPSKPAPKTLPKSKKKPARRRRDILRREAARAPAALALDGAPRRRGGGDALVQGVPYREPRAAFDARLEALDLRVRFGAAARDLEARLSSVEAASTACVESASLWAALALLRDVGNVVNGARARRRAGFRLDALSRLEATKAADDGRPFLCRVRSRALRADVGALRARVARGEALLKAEAEAAKRGDEPDRAAFVADEARRRRRAAESAAARKAARARDDGRAYVKPARAPPPAPDEGDDLVAAYRQVQGDADATIAPAHARASSPTPACRRRAR